MIYLPEVETIRRELDRDITGKKIKSVEVLKPAAVKLGGGKKRLIEIADGAKIAGVRREGRYIVVDLDNDAMIAMHLGEDAVLLRTANKDDVVSETAVIVSFTQQGQLRLVDYAGDAAMVAAEDRDELEAAMPDIASLGMDPIATPMSWTDFGRQILTHHVKLKSLLTDESIVVGLGDVYSDEVLFNAGLRYDRYADSLNPQELRRFYRGLVETLHDAVKYRGSTIEGSHYTDPEGEPGSYQDHLQVFGKHGELSPRSRQPIVRKKYSGRWTYFCEQSQV